MIIRYAMSEDIDHDRLYGLLQRMSSLRSKPISFKSQDSSLSLVYQKRFLDKELTQTIQRSLGDMEFANSTIAGIKGDFTSYSDKNCRYRVKGYDGWGKKWKRWMLDVRLQIATYLSERGVYIHGWDSQGPVPNHLMIVRLSNGEKFLPYHSN